MSSLLPRTTRLPRITRDSDGKPRLLLLVTSKALRFEVVFHASHGTPPLDPRKSGARMVVAESVPFNRRIAASGYALATSPNDSDVCRCDWPWAWLWLGMRRTPATSRDGK